MKTADSTVLPHQYANARQRDIANHLGMWTLIASEVLFFGGLFLAYFIYRVTYPAAFSAGSHRLDFWSGTINTAVLLTSSLSMALGDALIKRGERRALSGCITITAALGIVFLGVKFFEYRQMFRDHLVPGILFDPRVPPQEELFIFLYFVMTAIHALHMVVGIGAMAWLLRLNRKGTLSAAHHAPVEMVGLYWHFVDCVWVFLYPLLYLIPR